MGENGIGASIGDIVRREENVLWGAIKEVNAENTVLLVFAFRDDLTECNE
jgi:hypothetical protein